MSGAVSPPVRLHLVVELGVHLGVHLVDDVDGGRVVDQEEADLLQALLLCDILPLGERFQEVGLIGGRVQCCLETGKRGGGTGLEGAELAGWAKWGSGRGLPQGPCWAGFCATHGVGGKGKGQVLLLHPLGFSFLT